RVRAARHGRQLLQRAAREAIPRGRRVCPQGGWRPGHGAPAAGGARSLLQRRRRAAFHRRGLPEVHAGDDGGRTARREADPESGDGRDDGPEPDRGAGAATDAELHAAAREGPGGAARPSGEVRPRFCAEPRALGERPRRSHADLGRNLQHVLLDRPRQGGVRRPHDADAAVLRGRAAGARVRLRPGRVRVAAGARPMRRAALLLLALSLCAAIAGAQSPDLILVNGRVYTLDASRPWAEGVAITGERITAVGTTAAIRKQAGPRTRTIDLGGAFVSPGFNDAHVDMDATGALLAGVNLLDVHTEALLRERLRGATSRLPKGSWILRGDWGAYEQWGAGSAGAAAAPGTSAGPFTPDRRMIDAVSPDHPVFVSRFDRSMFLANSVALKLAG